jgi:class 3 adenylate cyclase
MVAATPIRARTTLPASLPPASSDISLWNGEWPGRGASLPVHRSMLAVDIEGSTQRTNPVKEELRKQVYRLVLSALGIAGVSHGYYDPLIDRGDGVLILLRPVDEFPKPLIFSHLLPALMKLLIAYNSGISPADQACALRLRVVVHAGEVHYDKKGPFGDDLDLAFRLLDAPQFKACLRKGTSPLAVVASDYIYRSIIRHGYDGINGGEFLPRVAVTVGFLRSRGWVSLPGAPVVPVTVPPGF